MLQYLHKDLIFIQRQTLHYHPNITKDIGKALSLELLICKRA